MSRYDYLSSRELALRDPPFAALIMAAMRKELPVPDPGDTVSAVSMPKGARLLHLAARELGDDDTVYVWALVDTDQPTVTRSLIVLATGWRCPPRVESSCGKPDASPCAPSSRRPSRDSRHAHKGSTRGSARHYRKAAPMADSKSTELIRAADFGLVALDENSEVAEILAEALAGEQVGLGDLERVKWPTGGATRFERTVLGNVDYVETIEGVIVHQRMARSYWKGREPQEGQQPDCTSPDGTWGYGDPGDSLREQNPPRGCDVCPMAQFGSAPPKDGVAQRGQACKLMRDFFILTPGATFPLIVSIPPGSLGEAKGYVVELASFGIRYYNVVSRLSLAKVNSKGGQPYAQARVAMVGKLDDASTAGVAAYRERMVPALSTARVGPEPAAPPPEQPADDEA